MYGVCVFFFKQKTAYEMRISDWSSDVYSSDLNDPPRPASGRDAARARRRPDRGAAAVGWRRRIGRRRGSVAGRCVMTLELVLPVVWFGVIGFGVLMYVLLDGFVLGLGILAPFAEDEAQLDRKSTRLNSSHS